MAAPHHPTEIVSVSDLRAHPRNYRVHPDDQLAQIVESLREHGVYRNVVTARDLTILAGHGVVEAAKKMGLEELPIIRLDLGPDDPRALKVLAGDNELGHLAEVDDRALAEILRDVRSLDPEGLNGTGYDDKMLAALVFTTRDMNEIRNLREAADWAGMPEFKNPEDRITLIVSFRSLEDKIAFGKMLGVELNEKSISVWWPAKERDTPAALRFVAKGGE